MKEQQTPQQVILQITNNVSLMSLLYLIIVQSAKTKSKSKVIEKIKNYKELQRTIKNYKELILLNKIKVSQQEINTIKTQSQLQYLYMQNAKSIHKNTTKNNHEKQDKIIGTGIPSPNSKKISRCLISAGEHPHYIKKNSTKSNQSKEQTKDNKELQKEKEDSKRQSRESKSRQKLIDVKALDQKVSISLNSEVTKKISSIPLLLGFNENQQIQEFNVLDSKNQNSSCVSEFSVTNTLNFQQNWLIGEKVGIGSTSEVYKAFDKFTGRVAAVKKMRMTQDLKTSELLSMLTKLKHPHIVEYYGFYKSTFELSLYMQFIPTTLQFIYKKFGGTIPYQNIRKYTRQILNAIQYLHQQKTIHKDIKCSNILLNQKGIVKLSDFGCSKQFDQSTSAAAYLIDGALTFKGSVCWTAPQVLQSNTFRRKSDIWSIGCTCLQMVTGKYPWSEKNFENDFQAIYMIGTTDQIPFIPSNIPQDLQDFIKNCLVRDPEKRKTAQQLLKTPFIMGK